MTNERCQNAIRRTICFPTSVCTCGKEGCKVQPQCRQCTDQTGNGGSSVLSHWTWQQTTAECMKGTMRLATGSKSCESLVVASRRLRESIVKVSTQAAVVSERGQRRTKVFEVHGQHQHQQDPSFENRDRGTNADDAVQGQSSTCHRGAAMECHGSNASVRNKLIGPSTSVVFGSRGSATLRWC